jgi:hypothetical protein
MKIYRLSQDVNTKYDTYDSCVVIADNEEEAKLITPSGERFIELSEDDWLYGDWVRKASDIKVEYIGEAKSGSKKGVICSSFNAG